MLYILISFCESPDKVLNNQVVVFTQLQFLVKNISLLIRVERDDLLHPGESLVLFVMQPFVHIHRHVHITYIGHILDCGQLHQKPPIIPKPA